MMTDIKIQFKKPEIEAKNEFQNIKHKDKGGKIFFIYSCIGQVFIQQLLRIKHGLWMLM